MTDSEPNAAIQELMARGLVASAPPPRLLARGNVDRSDPTRESWLVVLPSGQPAKLTLGRHLADLSARHAALSQACPTITTRQLHFVQHPSADAILETFFAGPSAESAATSRSLTRETIRHAVARTWSALAATERPSTESSRIAEWNDWTKRLLSLPVWSPPEGRDLQEQILPALYAQLATGAPVTRWTNGDFLPANILVNDAGEVRLVDAEFAARTHFFAEDAVRFRLLSPAARAEPDLFAGLLPEPDLGWHLYFWLRQYQLEAEQNTPDYLARVRLPRLGAIRRLGEMVLGHPFTGWSAPATEVHYALEVADWQQTADYAIVLTGWCHLPAAQLREVVVTHDGAVLARARPTARPDVQTHFGGDPAAAATGFLLAFPFAEPDARLVLSAQAGDGALLPFHSFRSGDLPGRGPMVENFTRWAALYDPDPSPPAESISGPLFSILLPIFETPPDFLRSCLESVCRQHYSRWELCVVDDASPTDDTRAIVGDYAGRDPRVRFQRRPANGGISRATNDALAQARGEFVVLLDHDDLLRPHALTEFARRLIQDPALDALYSDEDKITADGTRIIPFPKPGYSPEFLLGVMYVGHALCVRTSLAREAGGFDPAFDGIQDYEFFLRVRERTGRIGHVPRILYHWRQSPASSALHGNIKGDMDQKQAAAVQAHLRRRGRTEQVIPHGRHRLRLIATSAPTVEEVHPNPGENGLAALRRAVAASTADVLVLLSAETLGPGTDWMPALAATAALDDSGLVAPLILSAEGRVLESGWTAGPEGSRPLMRGFDASGDGQNGSLLCTREVAAVSPLCVAVSRSRCAAMFATGSASESWLEFCERWRRAGQFHRVCAPARIQLAIPWRAPAPTLGATQLADPFFNPHFDPRRADYSLARPPPFAPPVLWHLDTPLTAGTHSGCLILRGWGFGSDGRPLRAVRAKAPGLAYFGAVGLPRPDVRMALPAAPNDNSGFEIRGILPPGRVDLELEASVADGTWHPLSSATLEVPRPRVPLWLRGGDWLELMYRQMPTHVAHPPRPVQRERFPRHRPSAPAPRLTIVTPSYNQARFLPETMRSVLEQADVACDYVVQDGGSTDGSAAYIESQAGRLHAWASERDDGQADAIVRGFARTSGEPNDAMAWINSDDFYLPGALGYVAGYFARHPEVDVVYGHRIVVDEESREIARWFMPRHDPTVLQLNDFVPQETLFWRRRAWDRVGGVDPTFKFAMDWDLLLRFQAAGARIVRVPYFLACFRVHATQKTAAQMQGVGQEEIIRLRQRTHGRSISPAELEGHPALLRYLRRSAFIGWLWSCGVRCP
ncbi:MAG TPA: glycosyltransferase [Lacunisphaera sp.]|nr:glycosyltransferase [Lacunisphaera sp.]